MEDDLGVAAGAEYMAVAFQLSAQFAVVVDLAAVGEGEQGAAITLLDEHGLFAALDVDDGEAAVAQGGVGVQPDAAGVGAAAGHGPGHGVEGGGGLGGGEVLVVGDPSGDAAHVRVPLSLDAGVVVSINYDGQTPAHARRGRASYEAVPPCAPRRR